MSSSILLSIAAFLFGLGLLSYAGLFTFVLASHLRFVAYHKRAGLDLVAPKSWMTLWLRETHANATVALWALFAPSLPDERGQSVVLCVHGFIGHKSNWRALRRRLKSKNVATQSVALGFPPKDLKDYVGPLRQRLLALRAEGTETIDVVCHSMGGLVLRQLLSEEPSWEDHLRVIITVGTPHLGTASVPTAFARREIGAMRYENEGLGSLMLPAKSKPKWYTIGSACDYVVFPFRTTTLPEVESVYFKDIGHIGLLMEKPVLQAIVKRLERKTSPID